MAITKRQGAYIYALGVLIIGLGVFLTGWLNEIKLMSGFGLAAFVVGVVYVRALKNTSTSTQSNTN